MFLLIDDLFKAINDKELDKIISDFFKYSLEQKIGFKANDISKLPKDEIVKILYAIYCWASIDASGAGGGLNKSCKGAVNFKNFLENEFNDRAELLSFNTWLKKIGSSLYKNYGKIKKLNTCEFEEDYHIWLDKIHTQNDFLQYRFLFNFVKESNEFYGMKIKTASLLFKVLIKDLRLFKDFDYDNSEIFIPFDRVNFRMLIYFLLNIYDESFIKKSIFSYEQFAKYTQNSQLWFNYICYKLREESKLHFPLINFENLWYIGHFYHENMKKTNSKNSFVYKSDELEIPYKICNFREALKYGDYFVNVQKSNFSKICPFLKFGCSYDFNNYNQSLILVKEKESK